MAKVTITIGLDGAAVVEGHGFSGSACERATETALAALGGEQDERKKPEYWDRDGDLTNMAGN